MGRPKNFKDVSGIYIIISPTNCIYIGKTNNLRKRYNHYSSLTCHGQKKLYSSIKKYGVENHEFGVLMNCAINELNLWEMFYIKLFDSFDTEHGLNLTSGGDGAQHTEEAKSRIGKASKGRVASEETKAKLSISHKRIHAELTDEEKAERALGLSKALKGKPKSEDWRSKLSKAKIGKKRKPFSQEWIDNLSKAHKKVVKNETWMLNLKKAAEKRKANGGYVFSDEHKEAFRKSSVGRKMSDENKKAMSERCKGRVVSEETRRKISEAKKKITNETRLKLSEANKGRKRPDLAERNRISKKQKIE